MADISKLEQQADLLFNNVAGWEQSTLQRIGKRIGKYGKMSLADVKSINNIAVVKQDMDAITKELAKVTGLNISQIEKMYGDLLTEQHLANQPLYDYRGKTFVPFAENRELQAIARAYAKSTGETMINLAKTKALCVLDHNGNVKGLQRAYTDVLGKAVMQVSTGATDFHTAMRDSIIELGGSGVRVDYGGGVTRRLDTVVRQNLLWGAKQSSVAYNELIYDELGCSGYEVDWHSNPRPSHEFMQGKQFVVGKARTINGVHFDSFDEANERLQDYGCLHYKTPIICGISEPRYSPEELKRLNEQNARRYTIDGKEYSGYEVTQMQRRLESSVRNEKTTRDLAKASGDNALVKRCNERIKAYQTKYNEISEITGIQGDKKRMSVVDSKIQPLSNSVPAPTRNFKKTLQNVYDRHSVENNLNRVNSEQVDDLVSADYSKLSKKSTEAFEATLKELTDEYDTPLCKVSMMEKNEVLLRKDSFAYTTHNYETDVSEIIINPLKCGDYEKYTEKIKDLSGKGWCANIPEKYADKYIATHEFAHTLANLEQPLIDSRNWVGANYKKIKSFRKEISEQYNLYVQEISKIETTRKSLEAKVYFEGNYTQNDLENLKKYSNLLKTKKISNYSMTNADEFMAEAFTHSKLSENVNEYADNVKGIIDKYFRR